MCYYRTRGVRNVRGFFAGGAALPVLRAGRRKRLLKGSLSAYREDAAEHPKRIFAAFSKDRGKEQFAAQQPRTEPRALRVPFGRISAAIKKRLPLPEAALVIFCV